MAASHKLVHRPSRSRQPAAICAPATASIDPFASSSLPPFHHSSLGTQSYRGPGYVVSCDSLRIGSNEDSMIWVGVVRPMYASMARSRTRCIHFQYCVCRSYWLPHPPLPFTSSRPTPATARAVSMSEACSGIIGAAARPRPRKTMSSSNPSSCAPGSPGA